MLGSLTASLPYAWPPSLHHHCTIAVPFPPSFFCEHAAPRCPTSHTLIHPAAAVFFLHQHSHQKVTDPFQPFSWKPLLCVSSECFSLRRERDVHAGPFWMSVSVMQVAYVDLVYEYQVLYTSHLISHLLSYLLSYILSYLIHYLHIIFLGFNS